MERKERQVKMREKECTVEESGRINTAADKMERTESSSHLIHRDFLSK
jgi:hypothetical protein